MSWEKNHNLKLLSAGARVNGRLDPFLSRTLNTMSRYGIVDLLKQERSVKPIVKVTDFKVEFGLSAELR